MSYKEITEFLTILKELECPETVDIDSFQYPDFPVVARILKWLVNRCDSAFQIPLEIEVDQDRVFFLKAITDHMILKYSLALDARKLYLADGHAARELLKVGRLLTNAQNIWAGTSDRNDVSVGQEFVKAKVLAKVMDLQTFRKEQGKRVITSADMAELLRQEPANHVTRINALNMKLDPAKVEQALNESITETENLANEYDQKFLNIEFDKANLEAKIKKREEELDRMQRRLHTIQKTKPTHLRESDKLENELKDLYNRYSVAFRVLHGVEHEVQKAQDILNLKHGISTDDVGAGKRILNSHQGVDGSETTVPDDGFNEDTAENDNEPEWSQNVRRVAGHIQAVDNISVYSPKGGSDEEDVGPSHINPHADLNNGEQDSTDDDF